MEKLKQYIKFYKFEKRVSSVYNSIPSYEKLKKYIDEEWDVLGEMLLKVHSSDVPKLIPIKSVRVTSEYFTHKSVFIKYNRTEFNKVMKNETNKVLIRFLTLYLDESKINRRYIYENYKDTFNLLLDCIESKYYIDNEKEIRVMLDYLMDSFDEISAEKVNHQDMNTRVKIELEFIKMQREKKQGFDFQ